jgi:hypothetical protein
LGRSEVDAALDRLVSQFASPYDFLRELVQNSMDAGSDRVEVSIERHLESDAAADGMDAVFELVVMDTGVGMDETIIDGALTRLFASTKFDDRTMAGGFGVGFVSVFAWEPEVVLVQTGRAGEAWELTFHADRRFEKTRLDMPVEGTTITMLRRADASAYAAVADAVRDSLWRWCRFTEVEVSFEDFSEGDGPELIQDAPTPEDFVLSRAEKVGDGHVRVAFGIPAHAIMMRRGLILEEGDPSAMIKGLASSRTPGSGDQPAPVDGTSRTAEHLALWVDSPELETTLARDSIVENKGREHIEAKVLEQVALLRADLISELENLCADVSPWTRAKQSRYATLHAHLALEWAQVEKRGRTRPILRAFDPQGGAPLGGRLAWTPLELAARLTGGPLVIASRDWEQGPGAQGKTWGSAWPVLEGEFEADLWMGGWARAFGCEMATLDELLGHERADDPAREELPLESAFIASVEATLARLVDGRVSLRLVAASDASKKDPPLCAWSFGSVAMTCRRGLPAQALENLLLDRRHLLVQACLSTRERSPLAVRANLASALLSCVAAPVEPKRLQEQLWEVREGG